MVQVRMGDVAPSTPYIPLRLNLSGSNFRIYMVTQVTK